MRIIFLLIFLVLLPISATADRYGKCVLQFDDGRVGHYQASKILEQYGYMGSFGIVCKNVANNAPWALTPQNVIEMAANGHEIHNHTWAHNDTLFADPSRSQDLIDDLTLSQTFLYSLGISTTGLNQPGGPAQGWHSGVDAILRDFGFTYCAGRVGLSANKNGNFHVLFKDDPYDMGRSGVFSWGYNYQSTPTSAQQELNSQWTRICDAMAQGLMAVPVYHSMSVDDSTLWAIEEICKRLQQHNIQVLKMKDAVDFSRNYLPNRNESEIVNNRFDIDYDGNSRPDGWTYVSYEDSLVCLSNGAQTLISGPYSGPTRFSLLIRNISYGDDIYIQYDFSNIDSTSNYSTQSIVRQYPTSMNWTSIDDTLTVPTNCDRIRVMVYGILNKAYCKRFDVYNIEVPTTVETTKPHPSIKVYPNPTDGIINIESGSNVVTEIYNVLGQRVLITTSKRFRFEAPSGVYFMKIKDNSALYTQKIVKVK